MDTRRTGTRSVPVQVPPLEEDPQTRVDEPEPQSRVDRIMVRYSRPVSTGESCEEEPYCVGGAYLRSLGYPGGMPSAPLLARAFQIHEGMAENESRVVASMLINLNDQGNFVGAWRTLHNVLE